MRGSHLSVEQPLAADKFLFFGKKNSFFRTYDQIPTRTSSSSVNKRVKDSQVSNPITMQMNMAANLSSQEARTLNSNQKEKPSKMKQALDDRDRPSSIKNYLKFDSNPIPFSSTKPEKLFSPSTNDSKYKNIDSSAISSMKKTIKKSSFRESDKHLNLSSTQKIRRSIEESYKPGFTFKLNFGNSTMELSNTKKPQNTATIDVSKSNQKPSNKHDSFTSQERITLNSPKTVGSAKKSGEAGPIRSDIDSLVTQIKGKKGLTQPGKHSPRKWTCSRIPRSLGTGEPPPSSLSRILPHR